MKWLHHTEVRPPSEHSQSACGLDLPHNMETFLRSVAAMQYTFDWRLRRKRKLQASVPPRKRFPEGPTPHVISGDDSRQTRLMYNRTTRAEVYMVPMGPRIPSTHYRRSCASFPQTALVVHHTWSLGGAKDPARPLDSNHGKDGHLPRRARRCRPRSPPPPRRTRHRHRTAPRPRRPGSPRWTAERTAAQLLPLAGFYWDAGGDVFGADFGVSGVGAAG